MKFTQRWLLQHIETDLSPQAMGDRLTQAGLELEGLIDLSQGLAQVQTGVLREVAPHPNADRLTLCQVHVGKEKLAIVCGARNHRTGDKVAVARVGATLPNGLKIKKSRVRGELSEGMLCSATELGLLDSSEGILILPPETPDGLPVAPLLERDDFLFELGLTPNRGDCLGVRGIARELGALTGTPLRPLQPQVEEVKEAAVAIHLDEGVGCPRYAGRIIRGVRIAPSPEWLRLRLENVGLRSINNVVDITNFILMDLNQPLHAFDLASLHLPLHVRAARPGETLRTLDGVDRVLDAEVLVIADSKQALALAGIMGGEGSGVTSKTTDLLLESAYFDPTRTARTGRRLGILSDSRYRFERGTDPEGILFALNVATQWILSLAGGQAGPATLVDAGTWHPPPPVPLRPKRINQLGGIDLSPEAMETMLGHLGCQKIEGEPSAPVDTLLFQPPSHRHDLRREEDLLEEILRLYGYDRIESHLPRLAVNAPDMDPLDLIIKTLRRALSGRGYLEVINYAFVSVEQQKRFDPALQATALLNPISTEQAVMRTSLIAGLLENVQRNLSQGNHQLRLFEMGRVFLTDDQGVLTEVQRVAGLLSGSEHPRNWHTPSRVLDFFDLKGELERLLSMLGWQTVHFEPGGPDFLHPGRKAILLDENRMPLGWMGQIHPTLQAQMGLSQTVQYFELEGVFSQDRAQSPGSHPVVSRFPAVERDFAFVVDATLPAQQLLDEIRQVDPLLIRATTLFDVYMGQHVPAGQKSLALCVLLQADDRTLMDQEAQEVAERIVARVSERLGAVLRN